MSPSTPTRPVPRLEVRGSRASSVIVHHVPPDGADAFMEWQRGITQAAEGFPGYRGTDIYPPADDRQQEWVVVIHFDDPEDLAALARLAGACRVGRRSSPARSGDFRLKTLPTGFGTWFDGLVRGAGSGPSRSWKMALTVLLGLYPTVMLLSHLRRAVHVGPIGLGLSMLIGNALSVSILEWVVMPVLNRSARPLAPREPGRTEGPSPSSAWS